MLILDGVKAASKRHLLDGLLAWAALWMVLICMMNDHILLHFSSMQVPLGDFWCVLFVFEVWSFFFFYDLNLARSRSQLSVLFATSQSKIEAIHSVYKSVGCRPFCHSSSSSSANTSACLFLDPTPALCNLFISATSIPLKSTTSLSVKKSREGFRSASSDTFSSQQMWWRRIWNKFAAVLLSHLQHKPCKPVL